MPLEGCHRHNRDRVDDVTHAGATFDPLKLRPSNFPRYFPVKGYYQEYLGMMTDAADPDQDA